MCPRNAIAGYLKWPKGTERVELEKGDSLNNVLAETARNNEAAMGEGWEKKHVLHLSEHILSTTLYITVIKLCPGKKVLEQLPYTYEQKNSSIWESFILQKEIFMEWDQLSQP